MDLAERHGCLVDVHCDETDDPQSRFLEVLAEEARVRGMGAQVTASHTCAMGSYDNAYCSKLFRLLKASGINFISCPTESIHLQGRFDSWPKRRGVTRVAELDRAGINVCFAQDSIQDPWYPLGNGNIMRILDARAAYLPYAGIRRFAALPRSDYREQRPHPVPRRQLRHCRRTPGEPADPRCARRL
ncbi:cytosine deaminase [Klebsiella grimontii]|uniref:Cytosine deaminase n=1 Tax=Klebsiella grimontii TaxID=2058152 RepID=A0A7H4P816_9ENTR|nr:cytosine deaminase [Klebsiella grimontii]